MVNIIPQLSKWMFFLLSSTGDYQVIQFVFIAQCNHFVPYLVIIEILYSSFSSKVWGRPLTRIMKKKKNNWFYEWNMPSFYVRKTDFNHFKKNVLSFHCLTLPFKTLEIFQKTCHQFHFKYPFTSIYTVFWMYQHMRGSYSWTNFCLQNGKHTI